MKGNRAPLAAAHYNFRTASTEGDSSFMAPSNHQRSAAVIQKRHSSEDLYHGHEAAAEEEETAAAAVAAAAGRTIIEEDDGESIPPYSNQKNSGTPHSAAGISHRTMRSSSALLFDGPDNVDEDPLFLHEVLLLLTVEKLGEYPKDREFKFALLVMMVFDLLFQGKIILQRKSITQGGCSLERNSIIVVDDTKTRSPVLNEVFEVVAQLSTMEAKEMEEILEDLCGLSPNKSNKISKLKRRLVEYFLSRRILKQSTIRTRNRLVCLPSVVKTSYSVTNKKCKKYVQDLIARVGYTVAITHHAPSTSTISRLLPHEQNVASLNGKNLDNSGPREGILLDFDDNTPAASSSSSSSSNSTSQQPAFASPTKPTRSQQQQQQQQPPSSTTTPLSSLSSQQQQQQQQQQQWLTAPSGRLHVRGQSTDTATAPPMRPVLSSLTAKSDLLVVSDAQMRRALTIEEHARLLLHRDDMNSQAHVPFVMLMSMPFRNNVIFDTVLLNHDSDTRELVGVRAAELSSADPVLLELGQATAEILHNNRIFFNKKSTHGMVLCG